MSSNAPAMQQTMVMIRFLLLLECFGGTAAAEEEAAGAGCVGVADAVVGDDVDNEGEEDDEDAAVCCETAELITPTAEVAILRKLSRGTEVVEAACAMAPAALDKAKVTDRRS